MPDKKSAKKKNRHAVELQKLSAAKLTTEQRRENGRRGMEIRWGRIRAERAAAALELEGKVA